MDWTPWIGRQRPVEEDAFRILTVVHQLGEPAPEDGFFSVVAGEGRLQRLLHLIRHPVSLAFLLIAGQGGAERGRTAARAVRRLLPAGAAAGRHGAERLHRFQPAGWTRLDDVCAVLGCRNLLQVRAGEPPGNLSYLLTDEGAAQVERRYPSAPALASTRDRCRTLKDYLNRRSVDLENDLREAGRRIDAFRREERLAPEDDLLSRLFHRAFGEAP